MKPEQYRLPGGEVIEMVGLDQWTLNGIQMHPDEIEDYTDQNYSRFAWIEVSEYLRTTVE